MTIENRKVENNHNKIIRFKVTSLYTCLPKCGYEKLCIVYSRNKVPFKLHSRQNSVCPSTTYHSSGEFKA